MCSGGACALTCSGGTKKCGAICADVNNDPKNCGDCAKACAGDETCSAGSCSLLCVGGATKCGTLCVDTKNDPKNCLGCGNVCATPTNAVPICLPTGCSSVCSPNFGDCNGDGTDGCETDLKTNASHCGKCLNACGDGGTCVGGTCT